MWNHKPKKNRALGFRGESTQAAKMLPAASPTRPPWNCPGENYMARSEALLTAVNEQGRQHESQGAR